MSRRGYRRYEVAPFVAPDQIDFPKSIHHGNNENEAIRAMVFHLRDNDEGQTVALVDWDRGDCRIFRREGQQLLQLSRGAR